MKRLLKNVISAVYPNKCIGCGEIIAENGFLCDYCSAKIERNDLTNFCTSCGFEKDECVCNLNIYRFERIISIFKNDGVAQRAYYRYKFNKKQHYAIFFAREMTVGVERVYGDVKFDLICSVPSSRNILNNTHYDHSRYIAEYISKSLDIPYDAQALYCCKRSKLQHKSTIKERLTNVNGKYSYNYKIDGKTVLLVDDIRTTGATLDECSKMLLYAGAESVYCVTALGFKKAKK